LIVTQAELNGVAKKVLDAAFRVHSALGPGLLETAYASCLLYELRKAGLDAQTEVPVPIEGRRKGRAWFRGDLCVFTLRPLRSELLSCCC
jgi:GxxExxY protein